MDSKLSMNFTNLKFCDVKTSDIDETCSYIAQQEYSRFSASPCGCRTSCSESLYEVSNIVIASLSNKIANHISIQVTSTFTTWPSTQTWALIADAFDVKASNKTVTHMGVTSIEASQAKNNSLLDHLHDIRENVMDNFLKVIFHFSSIKCDF